MKVEAQVRRELVNAVYDSTVLSLVINMVAASALAIAYWPLAGVGALGWLVLLASVMLYRFALYVYYKTHADRLSFGQAERLFALGIAASALAWVAGPWFFLGHRQAAYDFLIAFVMGGLAAGAMTTLSPLRSVALLYLGITLGGTALWLATDLRAIERWMGLFMVIYLLFLVGSAWRIHRILLDTFLLRRENMRWVEALKAKKAEIEQIFDNVPVGIFFYDTGCRIVNVNRHFLDMFRTRRTEVTGWALDRIGEEGIVSACCAPLESAGRDEGLFEGLYPDPVEGRRIHLRMRTTALKDPREGLVGAIGIVEDISEEVETKRKIESFAQFYIQNPNPVLQVDCPRKRILIENEAARTIHARLGKQDPKSWDGFLWKACEKGAGSVDLFVEKEVYQFDVVRLPDGERVNLYGRNVTRERIARERADYLAYYDELTGLPRRKLLFEHVRVAMMRAERHGTWNALLFLDLDNFKQINDSMGHDVGDYLLMQLARRLTHLVRTGDIVARLGGDEFVILLADLEGSREEALVKSEGVARKVREEIARPFEIKGRRLHFGVSIGVTLFDHGRDLFDLLKEADVAMYEAKSSGKNSIRLFDGELARQTVDKAELMQDLHGAIEREELTIYYQPQVDLRSGRCVGVEALLRWEHARRGVISPGLFIPLAEECGVIHELGPWVLRRVARETAHLPLDVVAVNISIKEFIRSDFIEMVRRMSRAGEIDPHRIELEMTESVFIENFAKTNARLQELREMGFRFSIDDFGTGYSSLAYLKNLSIKTLKIDRDFIEEIGINPNDEVLTRTIIDIAAHFGMKTVAEGVENERQLTFLKKFGCDVGQGYYFGRPMAIGDLTVWYQDHGKGDA